jgi:hypothetical protein
MEKITRMDNESLALTDKEGTVNNNPMLIIAMAAKISGII